MRGRWKRDGESNPRVLPRHRPSKTVGFHNRISPYDYLYFGRCSRIRTHDLEFGAPNDNHFTIHLYFWKRARESNSYVLPHAGFQDRLPAIGRTRQKIYSIDSKSPTKPIYSQLSTITKTGDNFSTPLIEASTSNILFTSGLLKKSLGLTSLGIYILPDI